MCLKLDYLWKTMLLLEVCSCLPFRETCPSGHEQAVERRYFFSIYRLKRLRICCWVAWAKLLRCHLQWVNKCNCLNCDWTTSVLYVMLLGHLLSVGKKTSVNSTGEVTGNGRLYSRKKSTWGSEIIFFWSYVKQHHQNENKVRLRNDTLTWIEPSSTSFPFAISLASPTNWRRSLSHRNVIPLCFTYQSAITLR